MVKYFVIHPDGTARSEDAECISLLVGGYIQAVPHSCNIKCFNQLELYVNEEGFSAGLVRNDIGERIALAIGLDLNMWTGLCGPVVVVAKQNKSLSDENIENLERMVKEAKIVDFNESDANMFKRIRSGFHSQTPVSKPKPKSKRTKTTSKGTKNRSAPKVKARKVGSSVYKKTRDAR